MIKLYSTGCPKCIMLKTMLNQKGIQFEEINNEKLMIEKGFKTVPMLEIDNEILDFVRAVKWINQNVKKEGE